MGEATEKYIEKWYLKNITISILIILLSLIPLLSILAIPLIIIKVSRINKFIRNLIEQNTKNMSVILDKDNLISEQNTKLTNNEHEIQTLKELVSPDVKKIQELHDTIFALTKELHDLEDTKQQKIDEITKETDRLFNERTIKLEDLEFKLKKKTEESNHLKLQIDQQNKEIEKNTNELIELRDEVLLQSFALYEPQYDFTNSEKYKVKLNIIRNKQKDLIRNNNAVLCYYHGLIFDDSATKGEKLANNIAALFLRAFNSECEYIISKVKYNNFDTCLKRMKKSADNIDKLGKILKISFNYEYLKLKEKELRLALEYKQMKQKEKEEQQELRARMREEARIQRELDAERKKVEKEKQHYWQAFKEAQRQLTECTDITQKDALEEKLSKMQNRMLEIDKNLADINYRETNQKVGYVYVISNIGSFGENIYKIGMTRRLNPQERVDELGNASVPFNFDVHAMIFSKDAPALETALHHAFDNRKVNMVNKRREFFNASLDEIEKVIKENFDGSVDFIRTAAAEQYRETLKIKQQLSLN